MNRHPSGRHEPDPKGDAAVARVNAIRAARGLPPIVERDPSAVRRELVNDRDSMMVAVAVLHRPGCGATIPDVLNQVVAGDSAAAAYDLPPGVAYAILWRTRDEHTSAVFDALDAELERFAGKCAADPEHIGELAHLAVDRLACATRTAIAASITTEGLPAIGSVADGSAITGDKRAQAADYAAGIAVGGIVERLRDDLLALAGLP